MPHRGVQPLAIKKHAIGRPAWQKGRREKTAAESVYTAGGNATWSLMLN